MMLLIILFVSCTLSNIVVELNVFSGTRNPVWEITDAQYDIFQESYTPDSRSLRTDKIGYSGFTIHVENSYFVVNSPSNELFLLQSMPRDILESYETIVKHVLSRIYDGDEMTQTYYERHIIDRQYSPTNKVHIIIGNDSVRNFDPKDWNYDPVQYQNNCYNYANYVRTDTFAQPGRGSGKKWSYNTCDDITASAVRDGLTQFHGDPLEDHQPDNGHYVGMLIWPETNFHWVRKDNSSFWSHKPGGTEARDVDNHGNKITDPSKADFSPWTQFCGYFISIPTKIDID